MTAATVLARVERIRRGGPRYIVERLWDRAHRRLQRPWTRIAPHLITDAALLRATGASDVDALWTRQMEAPFFLRPMSRAEWVRRFTRTYPDASAEVLARAERLLDHEFDLLGSGPTRLGRSLPWHDDFKTGRRWPLIYACDIQYNELDRPTDVKVPWELSRCQHFTTLGQAYWLSGDERFAQEYVDEVTDWIASNPYGYGVNWACAMDVALRAVSWIWGFYFFAASDACRSRAFRAALLRALYLHGEYVATHLEKSDLNGNHYLADGVGLVFLGGFFKATHKGRVWLDVGKQIVVEEIAQQVTDDGVDFEQSTAYHRLVLEAFATSYTLLELHGEPVPASAWTRLERMHEFVAAYTKPDGRAPLIGDADDGRIQSLGTQAIGDHRYLLSTGAVRWSRPDFKAVAGRFWHESFWLLGPNGLDAFERVATIGSAPQSRAFSAGGFVVLRSDRAHVVVDCGEVGMRGRGGHGHNDVLSFELFLNGFNVVTDCGAYLYTASREWRNRFRSTAFHNTVQVDDEEVNRFIGPDALWTLHYDAVPANVSFHFGSRVDRLAGAHRGYERLSEPVTVGRELILDRDRSIVVVRDTLTGRGVHQLVWRFHLDPAVAARLDGSDVQLTAGHRDVWLLPDRTAVGFSASLEEGWVSPSYGVKQATTVVVWRVKTTVPVTAACLFATSRLTPAEREQALIDLGAAR
jgi:Heparinase II/III-like protein/Heparinase II/III N-terminus